ncbi:hypothetical protein [Sorlinia euscelidii]|uniref:hypothetical protein n=1 Tax=Sorlinia euscelidii TaxID=3081148 RepID=UPI00374E1463
MPSTGPVEPAPRNIAMQGHVSCTVCQYAISPFPARSTPPLIMKGDVRRPPSLRAAIRARKSGNAK